MSVILTILKIIGIVLLVLLAVLLVLVILILLVPVRYQAQARLDGEFGGSVTVSYLLHLVHITVRYAKTQRYGKVRILGIPVFDFFPSEEKRKKKALKQQRKEEKRRKKEQKRRRKKKKKNGGKRKQSIAVSKESRQSVAGTERKTLHEDAFGAFENSAAGDFAGEAKGISAGEAAKQDEPSKWGRLVRKIKQIVIKAGFFFKNFIDKVKNIKYTIHRLYQKLKNAGETVAWYVEVWQREQTQLAVKRCTKQLKRLWHHLKPKRFEAVVEFGFDDPGKTGDVFGKLCRLYPVYANRIVLLPNFEKAVLKGSLFVKGRVRIAPLVAIGWKVLFDKDIRNLYNVVTGGVKHE